MLLTGCSITEAPAPDAPPFPARKAPAARFLEMQPGLEPRILVLTYHDVIARRTADSVWFDVTEGELEAQLTWLKQEGATFITLQQVYERLTTGSELPAFSVAVTFADNYAGFYDRGLPILRRHGAPTTMFVHTGHVGSRKGRPKMTWDQLRKLDREGLVTIASQTVSHPADLRKLSDAQLRDEMTRSRARLEQELGHEVRWLAYPNGKYDGRCAAAARTAGYVMAFTESQVPAEASPSILMVSRYVHTKVREAVRELTLSRATTRYR